MNHQKTLENRQPSTALRRFLLSLVALSGIALPLSCASRQSPREIQESATPSAPAPMACSYPEYFVTGPKIKEQMLALIASATDYILIDSFLTVTDSTTLGILEALGRKHDSGVRIHVLADSSSRFMRPGSDGRRYLEKAGISTAEYNPMRFYKLVVAPVMFPRDHRKFWIVDGRVLFLGGANIMATSLDPPQKGGNHDVMVAVASTEAIERMVESFVVTWNENSREKLREENFPVRTSHAEETRLWLFDQNRHRRNDSVIGPMVEGIFSVAREEVWLIQPYTFVTRELLGQIRGLVRRGVAVSVMLSGEVQSPRFHYASFYGIKDILKAGGKVWVYQPGKGALHSKVILADRRWASVGSANLNNRSYHLSNETNVVFEDPRSVREVVRTLETLLENCEQVTPEEARKYRGIDYYLTWRWMQWAG